MRVTRHGPDRLFIVSGVGSTKSTNVALRLPATAPCRALLLLLLLGGLLCAAAQENTQAAHSAPQRPSQISGTVVDASGAAIAGATILVRGADGAVLRTAESDRSGTFSFSELPAGNYRLGVSSPGFESKELSVSVGAVGGQSVLRITLGVGAANTTIHVQGRADDLIGIATSAGQITVGAEELRSRPLLRSGEILETLPGLIVTQHAGGGKANQYFLRGFNLDHGSDFAIFIDGMPLNLPSHAHGEGYADMNTVIPELVERVDARKGPYYAEVGDYGSAGAAEVVTYKVLPQNFVQLDGGMYQFARLVFGVSRRLGKGNLLYGGEAYHDGGPWTHSDNFYKFNGLATYSQGGDEKGFSITARGYAAPRWNSSDQIPYTAVPVVGFFGTLNPEDGGHSQRYSLQGEWHRQGANSQTQMMAYGFYYDLDLFSDFTYYLVDPYKGDQFEQQDRRWAAGFDLRHTLFGDWHGRRMETTFGVQLRNDWIHNGLFRTQDRVRTSKTYYTANYSDNGWSSLNQIAVLPAATDLNQFTETIASPWVSSTIQWTGKFRSILGFRADYGQGVLHSLSNPTDPAYPNYPFPAGVNPNTGQSTRQFLPSPKATLIFGPWNQTEFYVQGGFSYHTNDVRGATQLYEPVSPEDPFYNTPVYGTPNPDKIHFLIPTKGAEIGVRTAAVSHLQSTAEVWYLHSNSELLQDGDTGSTTPSAQPSDRYGVEIGNFYTPSQHWIFDADFADSRALFTADDWSDSTFVTDAFDTPRLCAKNSNCFGLIPAGGGTYRQNGSLTQNAGAREVPEAVRGVVAAGVTERDYNGFSASARVRYFGPRPLTSDALYTSPSTTLVNMQLSQKFNSRWSLVGEVLNLFNRKDHDVDYAYVAQIAPAATLPGLPAALAAAPPTTLAAQQQVANAINDNAAFTRVMHPMEPIQVRFSLRYSFEH